MSTAAGQGATTSEEGGGAGGGYHYARFADRNDARVVFQQLRAKLAELSPATWQQADPKQAAIAARLNQAGQRLTPNTPRLAVDAGYVADFAREGWPTVLALDIPYYFKTQPDDFDVLIVTQVGIEQQLPERLHAKRKLFTVGTPNQPFAPYVEVYAK